MKPPCNKLMDSMPTSSPPGAPKAEKQTFFPVLGRKRILLKNKYTKSWMRRFRGDRSLWAAYSAKEPNEHGKWLRLFYGSPSEVADDFVELISVAPVAISQTTFWKHIFSKAQGSHQLYGLVNRPLSSN